MLTTFIKNNKNILLLLLGIVVGWVIINLWFGPLNYGVLMGDDLHYAKNYFTYSTYEDGYLINMMKNSASAGKFRPVTDALLGIAFTTCGKNYSCFVNINLVVFLLNGFLITVISIILSKNNMIGLLFPPLIFIFSRFSNYSVLQVLGIMENIAMLFFLMMIFCSIFYIRTLKNCWMYLVFSLFVLITLTHERYIVLLVPIIYIIITNFRKLNGKIRFTFLSLLIIILAIYFNFRLFLLKGNFFTGTGGTSITDTFNFLQIMKLIFTGLLNMVGFNAGPTGLSGKNFLEIGLIGYLLGISVSVSLLVLIIYLISQKNKRETQIEWGLLGFFFLLFCGLIFSSSITIRQEYRWLYAPFIVFILCISYFLNLISSKKIRIIFTLIIFLSYLSVDLFYRNYVNNIFFMVGMQTSSIAKSDIVDKLELNKIPNQDIYLVTNKSYIRDWYFQNDYFFKFYSNNNTLNIKYFNYIDEISSKNLLNQYPLIFQISEKVVSQIPLEYVIEYLQEKKNNEQLIVYVLIDNFNIDKIGSIEIVDSPTGERAFLWDWHDESGIIKQTITMISPVSIKFSDISCNKSSIFKFSTGIPFSSGDGAKLLIRLENVQNIQKFYEVILPPAENDQIISWTTSEINIDEFCGVPFEITLEAISSSGETSFDWIAISDPIIYEIYNNK